MSDRKVYEPDELKELLDAAEVPADDRPRYLLPLHLLLPLLKREIGPIGKTGQMKAQVKDGEKKGPEYKFRQIEDILNEGHGPLVALGISWRKVEVVEHKLTANGKAQECVMRVRYELTGPLGDSMTTEAVGQAVDFGSDKATNKADTSARKNMLVDLLQLATEDPDTERPDRVDERPHVQRVSEAQYTEVAAAIKALPEHEREVVKEWAAERGMVVTKAALTRGDLAQLKPFVASRAKAATKAPEVEERPAPAEQPAEGETSTATVGNVTVTVTDTRRRAERPDGELVSQDDLAHLSTVMEGLTGPEREHIKAERTALALSIKPGEFTVGTLRWLLNRAQGLVEARQAAEQVAGATPPSTPPAAPANPAAARRAAGGAKLASKQERETVAQLLGQLSEEKQAEVEAWATSTGHDLVNLAAASFQPVMQAISNIKRTSGAPTRSKPEPPAAPDPEEARRERRKVQWQTLNDAVEALGVTDTWPLVMEELTRAKVVTAGATLNATAAAFMALGAEWDDWLEEMATNYKTVADAHVGRPFEEEAPTPNLVSEFEASRAQAALAQGTDDVDY